MRKQPLINNEYYHIYNRGVDKRDIFSDKHDTQRFIESIIEFNQINRVGSLRDFKNTKQSPALEALGRKSLVAIVAYCLNPNHFHFILKQLEDGGIAKFMQKLQAGYTSYFNIKNSRTGALFQGAFKSNLINNDQYFNKLVGYVNYNYEVHDIPNEKMNIVRAGDREYIDGSFKLINTKEGLRMLEIFGGNKNFEKHCLEIVSAIRQERGKSSLLEDEDLPR